MTPARIAGDSAMVRGRYWLFHVRGACHDRTFECRYCLRRWLPAPVRRSLAAHRVYPLGREHVGKVQCANRAQAGNYYEDMLAAGVTLHTADVLRTDPIADRAVLTARVQVRSPDPDAFPQELPIRLRVKFL